MILRYLPYWKFLGLLLTLVTLTQISCIEPQDELVEVGSQTNVVTGAQTGDASVRFFGAITDPAGDPISGVTVRAGASSTLTDTKGLWTLAADVVQTKGHVIFSHPAYVTSSRTVYTRDANTYEVDAQLLSRSIGQQVSAVSGGVVQVANSEATLTFGPLAFAKTDGTSFPSSSATVVAHYLDPTNPATFLQMPGRLLGRPQDASNINDRRALITYGMLAVELYGPGGETLVLADGEFATLSFPVPFELRDQAPSEIPLWFYDEAEAVWVEEGSATLIDGNRYEGQVTHFTFWNCDIPVDVVTMCGRVLFKASSLDAANQEFTGTLRARLTSPTLGTRYAAVGEDGTFCGYVPANEIMTFAIEGVCDGDLFRQSIGPFSTDELLPDITIDADNEGVARISGTPSCSGQAITNGYIQVIQEGEVLERRALDGSPVDATLDYCTRDGQAVIEVVDFDQLERSTYIYDRRYPLNLDTVEVCGTVSLDRYVVARVNGEVLYATDDFTLLFTSVFNPIRDTSWISFFTVAGPFPGPITLSLKNGRTGYFEVGQIEMKENSHLVISEYNTSGNGANKLNIDLENVQVEFSIVDLNSATPQRYKHLEGRIPPTMIFDDVSDGQVEVEVLFRF
ncbi:MAG: carboxypeptidase-like regulatory domain-containing protein [Saprospiraceae bacterium]